MIELKESFIVVTFATEMMTLLLPFVATAVSIWKPPYYTTTEKMEKLITCFAEYVVADFCKTTADNATYSCKSAQAIIAHGGHVVAFE